MKREKSAGRSNTILFQYFGEHFMRFVLKFTAFLKEIFFFHQVSTHSLRFAAGLRFSNRFIYLLLIFVPLLWFCMFVSSLVAGLDISRTYTVNIVQRVFVRFKLIQWGHSKLMHLTYFQFSLNASKYAVSHRL